jgi:glucose/arabinose dehydrogenase
MEDEPLATLTPQILNAFLNLTFVSPAVVTGAPSGLPRLYVAEGGGLIHQFDNDLQVEGTFAFLDLTDRVAAGADGGIRGFAFHPEWGSRGEAFVHYVADGPRRTVLSRFSRGANPDIVEAGSEEVLLEVLQPHGIRPGGAIAFGANGHLYVALGDGGPDGDAEGQAQDLTTLRGAILRLDVDGATAGAPYAIPADNPLAGNADGHRPEIFAWGFRDPSGLSFDPESGRMWVADRGPTRFDEVNVVQGGGNYGWPRVEARICHAPAEGCDTTGLTPPVFDYGNAGLPRAVVGGGVYRGSRNPELAGRYLMADRESGQLWAVDLTEGTATGERLISGPPGFSALGVDQRGEPHFANAADGLIYRLRFTAP